MDQGWAVIIGAVVALIGAIGAPWLRDAVQRRAAERRERRALLREAIAEHLDALMRTLVQGPDAERRGDAIRAAAVAASRLQLLLLKDEQVIAHIAEEALALAPELDRQPVSAETWRLAACLVTAYQMVVHEWYAERLASKDVRASYNAWCARLAAMEINDPFRPAQSRPVVDGE